MKSTDDTNIRIFLRDEADPQIYFSDRRLLKAVQMLTVSAASNNRDIISVFDLLLLKHILWHSQDDQNLVTQWLWDNLIPNTDMKGLRFLTQSLKDRIVSCFSNVDYREDDRYQVKIISFACKKMLIHLNIL